MIDLVTSAIDDTEKFEQAQKVTAMQRISSMAVESIIEAIKISRLWGWASVRDAALEALNSIIEEISQNTLLDNSNLITKAVVKLSKIYDAAMVQQLSTVVDYAKRELDALLAGTKNSRDPLLLMEMSYA